MEQLLQSEGQNRRKNHTRTHVKHQKISTRDKEGEGEEEGVIFVKSKSKSKPKQSTSTTLPAHNQTDPDLDSEAEVRAEIKVENEMDPKGQEDNEDSEASYLEDMKELLIEGLITPRDRTVQLLRSLFSVYRGKVPDKECIALYEQLLTAQDAMHVPALETVRELELMQREFQLVRLRLPQCSQIPTIVRQQVLERCSEMEKSAARIFKDFPHQYNQGIIACIILMMLPGLCASIK